MSTSASLLTDPKRGIAGRVKDFTKASWDVRDARPTKYGFNLYFGTPRETYYGPYRGPSKLIVTKALRDFWHANRTKKLHFFLDLPASSSGLQTALRRLRFSHREDVKAFWKERVEDLAVLPTREFAAKHGVDPVAAFEWRLKLVKRGRPAGWWRAPAILKVLLSDMPLGEAGRELGIAISEVHRLRRLAKREAKST
ncbi:MAG: hypothetical protein WBW33_03010 [Bryobacteraceae bacterium]